ncbi:maleylpyruvate isomerase family mycothiol-dependent enzyme [Nocardioides solisilvae]|uniref:maleylpyruvate isomerase family mycothiol-dependent enzyme n=1 Tax=Nocardioides solisilvae TaxID=1542435 RepID=UPI0013A52D60|nr:maleylpyruvate isomerase family mycothiol-dependent enzyme [Nocardioides solisilvae]
MRVLELLRWETARLVRSVDSLDDDRLAGPSLLPGWSRAHVVAHLALNAEGLARALEGLRQGAPVPQYDSAEARARDIEVLAAARPADLRDRFLASTTTLVDALAALPAEIRDGLLEQRPGGPSYRAGDVPAKRVTEVVLHHVDLDAGHGLRDIHPEAGGVVLDLLGPRLARMGALELHATDLDRHWAGDAGPGGTVVSGRAAEIAWWLSGRGTVADLQVDGDLPEVRPW